jgi:hypothetical protein
MWSLEYWKNPPVSIFLQCLKNCVDGTFRYRRAGEHIADIIPIFVSLEELRSAFLSYSVKIHKISKLIS